MADQRALSLPSDARALSMGLMVALNHVVADDLHRTYMESAKQCLRECANEIERAESAFQGVMKDNADLAEEIQLLQRALAFWLPHVPARDDLAAKRCGDDSMLLGGYEGLQEPCAEELGWITMHAVESEKRHGIK